MRSVSGLREISEAMPGKKTQIQERKRAGGERRPHPAPPAKCRKLPAEPVAVADSREALRDVLIFIERQISTDLSLRKIANLVGLPILQFARQFREITGLTLWHYVRHRQAAAANRKPLRRGEPRGRVRT